MQYRMTCANVGTASARCLNSKVQKCWLIIFPISLVECVCWTGFEIVGTLLCRPQFHPLPRAPSRGHNWYTWIQRRGDCENLTNTHAYYLVHETPARFRRLSLTQIKSDTWRALHESLAITSRKLLADTCVQNWLQSYQRVKNFQRLYPGRLLRKRKVKDGTGRRNGQGLMTIELMVSASRSKLSTVFIWNCVGRSLLKVDRGTLQVGSF